MGDSKIHVQGRDGGTASVRTAGALGSNGDAGDPDTPRWFVGDTPGPLGVGDHADPDVPRNRASRWGMPQAAASRPAARQSLLAHEQIAALLCEQREASQAWLARQARTPEEARELMAEARLRLEACRLDEEALQDEIEKVRQDIEVYQRLQVWFVAESSSREVLVEEVRRRFNDLRWGGKGVKVGGIDVAREGKPQISQSFRDSRRAIVVTGYELHEAVHQRDFDDTSAAAAFFGSLRYSNPAKVLPQTWAAGRTIRSELAAHGAQRDFYVEALANVRSESLRCQRLVEAL